MKKLTIFLMICLMTGLSFGVDYNVVQANFKGDLDVADTLSARIVYIDQDGDTLKINLYKQLYIIDLEVNDSRIFGLDSTGNVIMLGDATITGGDITLAAAGIKFTAADGVLTLLGLGNGNDENLTFDFDNAVANEVNVASGTGVTGIDFGTIDLKTDYVWAQTFDTDVAAAAVTLTATTLAADGTDAHINIAIIPKGTGEVDITKVDIDGGAIDGTVIGANSASTGAFSTGTFSGILSVDDVTETTSGVTGSIHTDGGLGVAKDIYVGDDILLATAGIIDWNATDKMTHGANLMTLSGFTTWDMGAVTTLDFDGTVAITVGAGDVDISGASVAVDATEKVLLDGISGHTYWAETSADEMSGFVGAVEAITIKEATNVMVGIQNASLSGWHTTKAAIQLGGNASLSADYAVGTDRFLNIGQNANYDTDASWEYISTDEATLYSQGLGIHTFSVAVSGTAGNDVAWITGMKVENDADIIIFGGAAAKDYTLTFNGETNDGVITYMEDEDRIDFDNDVDVIGDLTAGTVASDADVTGATVASITAANLLDKSANESISGIWTFTNEGGAIVVNDSAWVDTLTSTIGKFTKLSSTNYGSDNSVSDAELLVVGALTATASEINTPLDGALVTLVEFQQLETIGATTVSANQWIALGGLAETLIGAEVNILDGVTGVTAAELSYIGDVTSAIQAQINLKAPLASPTFTTQITTPKVINSGNVGAVNTGVTAVEYGDGYRHTTVLTVSQAAALTVGNNVALADGYLLYTFPAGVVVIDYVYMTISIDGVTEQINDTPDVGLGTVIGVGAVVTLDGTGTFENIITGQLAADCNGTATVKTALPTAAVPFIIESGGAHTLHFNIADTWAAGATDLTADIAGTVVIVWSFLQ